jgi:LacI family transcriptional regulator, gluconate utilization system Gnt-I transcriptional repressor
MTRSRKKPTDGGGDSRVRPERRPTIREVSRLAGVSHMTVSRVIRDLDLVQPETRARVHKAIADLGYVPDRAAGSLASRRTGFIALILPTLTNTNFAAVAHGLTEALRPADFDLLIAYTEYSVSEEERQLKGLLARRPEAIVLTGSIHSRGAAKMLLASGIPVIEIADLPRQPLEHAVGFSNYEVGRSAARYLLDKGFERVGAVASSNEGDVIDHRGEERMRGFEDELERNGRPKDLVLRVGTAPVSFEHGAAVTPMLLDRRVDAVFAVSDLSAVGVVLECQRRGVAVPERLSVLGFGDFEIGSAINPPLSTVHVDFRALGERTGRLILDLLRGKTPAAHIVDVGLSIVERASVRGAG